MNDTEYFDGFEPNLPSTENILPSYHDLLGTYHGSLYIDKLLRKKNRNILLCICSCGREELLYRWQLKDKLSCSVCGIYTDEYIQKNSQITVDYFEAIKKMAQCNNIKFEISYDYVCQIFKDQEFKCALTGWRIIPFLHINDFNGTAILDMIDNKQGFIETNVHWIHKDIYNMKRNISVHELINNCEKIVEFNNNKKMDKTEEIEF